MAQFGAGRNEDYLIEFVAIDIYIYRGKADCESAWPTTLYIMDSDIVHLSTTEGECYYMQGSEISVVFT
jgi:hypothetical protein